MPSRRPLVGQRHHELPHRALRRRVGRHADAALEGEHRGDEDDAPARALRPEAARGGLGQQERRREVEGERPLPDVEREVDRVVPVDRAGVEHERVEAPVRGDDRVDHRAPRPRGRRGRPGAPSRAGPSASAASTRPRGVAALDQRDVVAVARQAHGHRLADAAARPRDEGDAAAARPPQRSTWPLPPSGPSTRSRCLSGMWSSGTGASASIERHAVLGVHRVLEAAVDDADVARPERLRDALDRHRALALGDDHDLLGVLVRCAAAPACRPRRRRGRRRPARRRWP